MKKYIVDVLDLVIIRSCQLSCEGCCTFSDHKEINGLVDVDESREAVKFWSQYIIPKKLHLFGGEPTMHPQLLDWFNLAKEAWPKTHDNYPMPVWLSTNGYFLDKLFDKVNDLFLNNSMFVSVTHHTTMEPYSSLVLNHYTRLKELILEANSNYAIDKVLFWKTDTDWDSPHKKYSILKDESDRNYSILNITHQHDDHFVTHYRGRGPTLKPWHSYDHETAKYDNHRDCHIKNYVQLYNGRLYKCPPRAVLNQTLETYNLQSDADWADYYNKYESIGMDATPEEIDAWFTQQKDPENTCNMCGFMYSDGKTLPAQEHLPKKLFKLKQA